MNVLDILKSVISDNSDSSYIEKYPSGDCRCSVYDEGSAVIAGLSVSFRGHVFHYISEKEELKTFWGDSYSCSHREFETFLNSLSVPLNNVVQARFQSVSEEIEITESLGLKYRLNY